MYFAVLIADGEAQSLRRQNHHRVHADDFAARIDQRPAGIARIQRRVRLDEIVHEPARLRAERPAQRAHHARRHRVLEAVGIADGDGELAHAQLVGIPEAHRLQVRRVNADDRQVRVRVRADEMRIGPATVGERDFNPLRAMHDVAVRENKTVRRDDETRPAAAAFLGRVPLPRGGAQSYLPPALISSRRLQTLSWNSCRAIRRPMTGGGAKALIRCQVKIIVECPDDFSLLPALK